MNKLNNYTYDNLNRLKEVSLDDLQNGKQLAIYQYNSFSQRIVKDINGNKTIFIYNSAGQLLEEINKAQNTTRDYIYVDGILIGATENGILVYIVTDHLNAPQLMMDSNGRQIWSATYTPFGKATTTGNIKLNLRADGQYQDDETGLYYNLYRYYNPDLGRYITSDPLGLAAGMNTYIYVNGNPINYTDPMGLMGVGGLWNGTIEGGLANVGAGSNTTVGGGLFWNQNQVSVGTFNSNGTVTRVPNGVAVQYPSMNGNPELKPLNQINGAYAGWGGGVYVTNANCAADLGGAGNAYSLNLPFASFSLGISGNIWVVAGSIGPSAGYSVSSYPTNTNTADVPIWSRNK